MLRVVHGAEIVEQSYITGHQKKFLEKMRPNFGLKIIYA